MNFSENLINGLNVVLNESSIRELILNEKDNHLICKLELLRENGTEKPNYANFRLENIKRYIAAYRTDIQNENKILKFNPNQISVHLQNFINRDIYGWEFFNVENSNFNFSELSFEYLKDDEFEKFNSLELFQESFNLDLEIKIWFENFRIFDESNKEIDIDELIKKQDNIWNSMFKK